jgi:hypothetical protein
MTKLGVLDLPHVLPLMNFVRHLRAQGLSVPSVDPKDGGIFARALFLLESPGPKAVGTQFISQDNPDWSARNMKRTLGEAGFLRSDVVLWNVVPYCVSTIDRNRNATVAQIIEAIPYTQAFVDELKSVRVVVYCGRRAQRAQTYLRFTTGVHQLMTFHPGPQAFNQPRCRKDMQAMFKRAFDLVMH